MRILGLATLSVAALLFGCATSHFVHVEPVRVDPIHLTMDVNVRVDGQVDAVAVEPQPEDEEGERLKPPSELEQD